MSETSNGWNEYKQKVLYQLEETILRIKEVDNKIDNLKESINLQFNEFNQKLTIMETEQKTKSKIFYALVTVGATAITIIVNIAFKFLKF